ncbi:hypothetical protein J6TS1_14670 [Siminovitchia terrae]|uniref:Uncharacterized protein n=1 Tax=Siminovitchia terrae TaxID=1914933 RepID=A0ABQ4KU76_SIMTE|nr:hypothetical protein J6TS1_14670 [Siminovitchia terrae]
MLKILKEGKLLLGFFWSIYNTIIKEFGQNIYWLNILINPEKPHNLFLLPAIQMFDQIQSSAVEKCYDC